MKKPKHTGRLKRMLTFEPEKYLRRVLNHWEKFFERHYYLKTSIQLLLAENETLTRENKALKAKLAEVDKDGTTLCEKEL